jgi:hypothetical protein
MLSTRRVGDRCVAILARSAKGKGVTSSFQSAGSDELCFSVEICIVRLTGLLFLKARSAGGRTPWQISEYPCRLLRSVLRAGNVSKHPPNEVALLV